MKALLRRYFLLLEVLISLTLTMVLISILLVFYVQINQLNTTLENKQEYTFKKLYLSTRLGMILPRIISFEDPEKDFFFYTTGANDSYTKSGSTALVFGFNNGVKLPPEFANHVVGRLYLDNDGKLSLAVWPSPARWKDIAIPSMRKEVLFENVESLSFGFYVPPTRNREILWAKHDPNINIKNMELLKLSPIGEWKQEWQQDYGALPYLIRLKIEIKADRSGKTDTITLIYPIPESPFMAVYE